MNESRIQKGILNAKINFIFYFIMLLMSFISRKIFLNTLGAEFMGLTGTLANILSMLSLVELGIGTSMSFHLYKPIREKEENTINEYISLFGWLYRIVGIVILIGAVIVSMFFPIIFDKTDIPMPLIYFVFFTTLCSSLIGYFINYRQLLLSADQKGYVVTAYLQTATVVKTIIQMVCCVYYLNYYLWAVLELVFVVIACIILNVRIDKTYPWLHTELSNGKTLYKKYPSITSSVKQIFVHRMKDFLLNKSDQILIFAFVSLKYVAYYGNYYIIISKVTGLFSTVMGSAEAGIGNLVAENDKNKCMNIFWELLSMRYFSAGILTVILYFIIPPFIEVWLGAEYLLSDTVLFLICLNMYIMMTRTIIDSFNHSFGHYADTWSAWVEGIINLSVTILVASRYGIIGILLGKIVSLLVIVVFWKPLYLFRDGFKTSYFIYWKNVFVYIFFLVISVSILYIAISIFPLQPNTSWINLILYSIYISLVIGSTYGILMYFFSNGLKGFTQRLLNYYKR